MSTKKRSWTGRIFIGRDENGRQQFHWVGRFPTKRERDDAVARARTGRPWEAPSEPEEMTGDALADRYLTWYEGRNKASSADTARHSLKAFRKEFGTRTLASITTIEAEDWTAATSPAYLKATTSMFAYAMKRKLADENPFAGLARGGRGRSDEAPPTEAELQSLREACDVHGDYGPQLRNLLDFAALTLLRPGELYEIRWSDIDFAANRIRVSRRLYRGLVDVPKSGKSKTIALPPPAHAILLDQLERVGEPGLVFRSKHGARLSAPVLSQYWTTVRAAAGISRPMEFYLASKHYGVSRLYRLGLSARAIAAQAGWSDAAVDSMLAVYGHRELTALSEIDALYQGDAPVTQETPNPQ